MGILDDAIREHLELKRRHGAASSDLERLENEAFGPSERPGEPESEEVPIPQAGLVAEPAEGLDESAEEPAVGAGESDSDWLEEFDFEPAGQEEPEGAGEAPASSEQARIEHSDLGDTVDHPAVEPEAEEEAAEAPEAPEEEPAEAPEAEIFDGGELDQEEELDLELELPEDAAREHPLPEQPDAEEGFEADDSEEDELEDEDEDLLEETPDFLQDTPEGERLWFEQRGKPKDFDFDE